MIAARMSTKDPVDEGITIWLKAAADGHAEARELLFKSTYAELRKLASFMMANQAEGHTLQATALLNEATLRLIGGSSLDNIADTQHFFRSVAQAMRCVLVDHARKRNANCRGGGMKRHELDAVLQDLEDFNRIDIIELDDALEKLAKFAPRQADLVHYRFFLGMSVNEIAEQQGVSKTTVERDWRFIRAWLANEMDQS